MRHLVALLLALSCAAGVSRAASEIAWESDLAAALARARETGRPVLVDLWAVWCVPCKTMDETTWRDPKVVAAMGSFVPVKIDHDVNETFVERHAVAALPTVLFLDATGEEIARRNGLLTAESILPAMAAVGESYREYVAWLVQLDADPDASAEAGVYLVRVGNPDGAVKLLRRASRRFRDADPTARERLDLAYAEAQIAAGDPKPAAALVAPLVDSADAEVRGRALVALVLAERARGREAEAAAALERLKREYPELAASVERAAGS